MLGFISLGFVLFVFEILPQCENDGGLVEPNTCVISSAGNKAAGAEVWILEESKLKVDDSGDCFWEKLLRQGHLYVSNEDGELQVSVPDEAFALAVRFRDETGFLRDQEFIPAEIHTRAGIIVFLKVRDKEGRGVKGVSLGLVMREPGGTNDGSMNSQIRLDEKGNGYQHFPVPQALMKYPIFAFAPGVWKGGFPEVKLGDGLGGCVHAELILPAFGGLRIYPDGSKYDSRWWKNKVVVQIEGGEGPAAVKNSMTKWEEYVDIEPIECGVELSVKLLGDAGSVVAQRSIELCKGSTVTELHLEAEKAAKKMEVFVFGLPTKVQYWAEYRILPTDSRNFGVLIHANRLTFIFSSAGVENEPISEIRIAFPQDRVRGKVSFSSDWVGHNEIELRVDPY